MRRVPSIPNLLLTAGLSLATWGCPSEDKPQASPTPTSPNGPGAALKGRPSAQPRPASARSAALEASLPPLARAKQLKFDVQNGSLWIHGPGLSTSLSERAHRLTSASHQGDIITVKYEDDYSCSRDEVLREDVKFFLARLENTRAFRLYREGDFAQAALGFRRAMKLDPRYAKARTNHIAALSRAGDTKAAQRAFGEGLEVDPFTVYGKLLSDEDFAPLRETFRSKAPAPSFLELGEGILPNLSFFSKAHDLLAVVRTEESWGAESWIAELHVFRASEKALLSEHSLVNWRDMNEEGVFSPAQHQEVTTRLRQLNETLGALKFARSPATHRAEFKHLETQHPALEAPLPTLGLRIVSEKDTLRLLRGEERLETFDSALNGARPHSIFAFPEMKTMVYLGMYEVAEGCDSGPETRLEIFSTLRFSKPKK